MRIRNVTLHEIAVISPPVVASQWSSAFGQKRGEVGWGLGKVEQKRRANADKHRSWLWFTEKHSFHKSRKPHDMIETHIEVACERVAYVVVSCSTL